MDTTTYDRALRSKIRFESPKGLLSLEQLWDVPLRSRNEFNLDVIAREANRKAKEVAEESFVTTTRKSTDQVLAEIRLDLVKHVIAVKLAEEEKAEKRAEQIKRREKLLDALERKQDASLEGMTEDEIKAELGQLAE